MLQLTHSAKSILRAVLSTSNSANSASRCNTFAKVAYNADRYLVSVSDDEVTKSYVCDTDMVGMARRALAHHALIIDFLMTMPWVSCPGPMILNMATRIKHYGEAHSQRRQFIAKLNELANDTDALSTVQTLYLYRAALQFPVTDNMTVLVAISIRKIQSYSVGLLQAQDEPLALAKTIIAKLLTRGLIRSDMSEQARKQSALRHYKDALAIKPDLGFAQYDLAYLYSNGTDLGFVDQSRTMAKAKVLLVKANNTGVYQSQYMLGLLYLTRKIELSDEFKQLRPGFDDKTVRCFDSESSHAAWSSTRMSLRGGYLPAIHLIALFFKKNHITSDVFSSKPNVLKARMLCQMAAEYEYPPSVEALKKRKSQVSPRLFSTTTSSQDTAADAGVVQLPSSPEQGPHGEKDADGEADTHRDKRTRVASK